MRANTGAAYLTVGVRARPNLAIRADTLVDKLVIEDGRATGVRLADGKVISASEVIVSAGVFGSPAILLRSGIGPRAHLDGLGIPVVADLPVGERLQDQPMFTVTYDLKRSVPATRPAAAAWSGPARRVRKATSSTCNCPFQFGPMPTIEVPRAASFASGPAS